ncbi:MAG TPA: TonB-dependent receptor [Steroidobacteraceae bacterium]
MTQIRPALVLALALTGGGIQSAMAQSGSGASGTTEPLQLQEVTVTATKVALPLQEVPMAVTAVTSAQITQQGYTDLSQIAQFTPGMSYGSTFGRQDSSTSTVIRGVTSISNAALSYKPYANFVDGVYVRGSLESFDLSDVERVEVLRGPQSALYGRGTEAGAINYITRQPTNDFEGDLDASFGSYGYQRFSGNASGPIVSNTLFFQVNGSYYDRNGEYLNLYDGRKDDTQQTKAGSASLRYVAGDAFDATVRVGYSRDDDGPAAIGYQDASQDNCFLDVYPYYCGTIHPHDYVNLESTPVDHGYTSSTTRASLIAHYRFNGFTVTNTTGWDTNHQKVGLDQSYDALVLSPSTGLPPDALLTATNTDSHSISEELRLTSPQDQALRYQLGAYWYYEIDATADVFAPYDLLLYGALNSYTGSDHNAAVFGQVQYSFNPQWTLSAELRLQRDGIRYVQPLASYDEYAAYDSVLPRVVLDYKVRPQVMLYASIGEGTKPGGFNSPYTPQDSFGEEKLLAYELGVKSEWLDRRLLVDADVYYNRIHDLQVTSTVVTPSGGINSYDTNAGAAHTQGIELNAAAKVSRVLTLRADAAWSESVYDSFQGFQDLCNLAGQYTPDYVYFDGPITDGACLQGPTGNARGKTLPDVPRFMGGLQADLTIPTSLGVRVFLRPAYSYKSSRYDESENLADTGSQGILNARLGVETDLWSITAWGTNLTNSRNVNYILRYIDFSAAGFSPVFLGPERSFAYALPDKQMFGLEGRIRF